MVMADLPALLTNPDTGPSNAFQAEAMRKILQLALLGGAAGVGLRTARGTGDFLRRNAAPPPKVPLRRSIVPIPIPVEDRPRSKKGSLAPPAEFGKEPLRWAAEHASNALGLMKAPGEEWGTPHNLISGWGARHAKDMPWSYVAAPAMVGGSLYGGYKLTDWLLDKTKKKEQESELAKARADYEQALLGQYGTKTAGVNPLEALATAYVEKKAGIVGPALGMALLGLGTVGLGAGMASYNWANDRSRHKALTEAIRRRQEALFAQAPSPIMAVPVPRPIGGAAILPDEEDHEERRKAAHVAQAADQALQRLKQQKALAWQQWQQTISGEAGKPDKQEQPEQPLQPQLPTLAGVVSRMQPAGAPT
jgi:hypothetical protein